MNLADLCKELEKRLDKLPAVMASETLVELQKATPVDTGHLRDSWKIGFHSPNNTIIENKAEYALYVENGTDKMAPRLFTAGTLTKADRLTVAACIKVGL